MTYEQSPYRSMRVIESFQAAMSRARQMLFEPFDATKWLGLGVIIFLDRLTSNGINTYSGQGSGGPGGGPPSGMGNELRNAENWALENIALVALIAFGVVLVVLLVSFVVLYLSARGQLMFARAVALDDGRIGSNWRAGRPRTLSLVGGYLLLAIAGWLVTLSLLALGYIQVRALLIAEAPDPWAYVAAALPTLIAFVLFVLAGLLVAVIIRNFLVPLMVLRDLAFTEALREFLAMSRGNWLAIAGFLGLKFLYTIAVGFVTMLVGCLTCCLGFLPVIHHALFAPYYVFDRAFATYLLQSADPERPLIEERREDEGYEGV